MADIYAERRAELEAALAEIEPQIRGLDDLARVSISADLQAKVVEHGTTLKRRRDLIQAELNAMDAVDNAHDALLADGYPETPPASLTDSLYAELQIQEADIEAAVSTFAAMASMLTVNLGAPTPKP
jgi:hypothetical protein